MKYLVKPIKLFFIWIGISIYFFYKVSAFILHFILDLIWHLNVKQAFTDAHTEYFAVFYKQTDEWIHYNSKKGVTVTERHWYYRTIKDFFNSNKTYEN